SSSRMTGLMNRTLAMPALLHEALEGRCLDAGSEQDAALGAIHRFARGRRDHLEEHVTKAVVGGVGEPGLAEDGVHEMNYRRREPITEHFPQLGVVLGLTVGRARRVPERET